MAETQPLRTERRTYLHVSPLRRAGPGPLEVLFRPSVVGAENIPLEGPVIIAPIHRSNVDFALTLFISKRKVFFMAKDSLFRVPLLGPLIAHLGAFPIRRGAADRESMAHSKPCCARVTRWCSFPKGRARRTCGALPLHDGAMFVAARTGAKVVPVGIGAAIGRCPRAPSSHVR